MVNRNQVAVLPSLQARYHLQTRKSLFRIKLNQIIHKSKSEYYIRLFKIYKNIVRKSWTLTNSLSDCKHSSNKWNVPYLMVKKILIMIKWTMHLIYIFELLHVSLMIIYPFYNCHIKVLLVSTLSQFFWSWFYLTKALKLLNVSEKPNKIKIPSLLECWKIYIYFSSDINNILDLFFSRFTSDRLNQGRITLFSNAVMSLKFKIKNPYQTCHYLAKYLKYVYISAFITFRLGIP